MEVEFGNGVQTYGIVVHTTEFLPKDTIVLIPKITVQEEVNVMTHKHTWRFEYDSGGVLVIRGISEGRNP